MVPFQPVLGVIFITVYDHAGSLGYNDVTCPVISKDHSVLILRIRIYKLTIPSRIEPGIFVINPKVPLKIDGVGVGLVFLISCLLLSKVVSKTVGGECDQSNQ
jgi:hypothetical protein